MWKRSKREVVEEPAATELGDECAAFLTGGYRDYLETRGRPVPAWAWVNRLAHGDHADIASAAARQSNDDTPEALIAAIAAAVLTRLQDGVPLEALQRNSLVPLEMTLAAQAELPPTSSIELGRVLRSALTTRLPPPQTRRLDQ